MIDWHAIQVDYVTNPQTSYRKLAEKYGVHYKQIADKGKAEGWSQMRSQHAHDVLTKSLKCDISQRAKTASELNEAAVKLLRLAVGKMESVDPECADTQEMKHISGVLKDIKDILMIKSEADMREQEARIANLRKQANMDDAKKPTLIIEGLPEEFRV